MLAPLATAAGHQRARESSAFIMPLGVWGPLVFAVVFYAGVPRTPGAAAALFAAAPTRPHAALPVGASRSPFSAHSVPRSVFQSGSVKPSRVSQLLDPAFSLQETTPALLWGSLAFGAVTAVAHAAHKVILRLGVRGPSPFSAHPTAIRGNGRCSADWAMVSYELAAPEEQQAISSDAPAYEKEAVPGAELTTSPGEDLLIGALAGLLKILLAMPLLTWKFKVQAGALLPTTLGEWYRGVAVQAGAVAPIAALQLVVNGALAKLITGSSPWSDTLRRPLTPAERMLAALGAGIASALIFTPVDMLTIQQQQLGTGLLGAASYILRHLGPGGLMRGALPMAIREGIFVLGMLGLTPLIAERLSAASNYFRTNLVATNLAASLGAGLAAALLTHPMDTIKTQIQLDLFGETYPDIVTTTAVLLRERGWDYLFLGALPRTLMICLTFFIVAIMRQLYLALKKTHYPEAPPASA